MDMNQANRQCAPDTRFNKKTLTNHADEGYTRALDTSHYSKVMLIYTAHKEKFNGHP